MSVSVGLLLDMQVERYFGGGIWLNRLGFRVGLIRGFGGLGRKALETSGSFLHAHICLRMG